MRRRSLLTGEQIYAKSRSMFRRLLREDSFHSASSVLCYASIVGEVQLYPVIEYCLFRGKRVSLPFVFQKGLMSARELADTATLKADRYGILSPSCDAPEVPPDDIDAIIVPGAAFTPFGDRLGMGGGYYDRFLPRAKAARRIALAFDFSVVPSVFSLPHDCRVDVIITETRTIFPKNQRRIF